MSERTTLAKAYLELLSNPRTQKISFVFNGKVNHHTFNDALSVSVKLAAHFINTGIVDRSVAVIGGWTFKSFALQMACVMSKNKFIALDSAEPDRFSFISNELIGCNTVIFDLDSVRADISLTLPENAEFYTIGSTDFKLTSNLSESKIDFTGTHNEADIKVVGDFERESISPLDVCVFTTTSGTTGPPKIIKLPNRAPFVFPTYPGDPKGPQDMEKLIAKFGAACPVILSNIDNLAGFVNFVGHMFLLLLNMIMDPKRNINMIVCDQHDLKTSIPAMNDFKASASLLYLPKALELVESEAFKQTKLEYLNIIFVGGAKVTPEHFRRLKTNFQEHQGRTCHVIKLYSSTEIGSLPIRTGFLDSDENQMNTDGRLTNSPGYALEIRGPDGKVLPNGEKGEVFLKTAEMMIGYVGHPDIGEWFGMGDEAYLTDDNRLIIIGRIKEHVVLVNTKKSNSAELDEKMMAVGDSVKQVVSIPRRNADGYDDIFFIVNCDAENEEVINSHVSNVIMILTKVKPDVIFTREAFPVLANGKYNKTKIAEKYIK